MYNPHNEYSQINDTETYAERQARVRAQTQKEEERAAKRQAEYQARAKAFAERQVQARADFDALGEEMAKTTTREELVELGRKREDLAPYTGNSYVYENVCWCCGGRISSAIHARCPVCRWFICSKRGSCSPVCNRKYTPIRDETNDPFLPDYPDDLS
jgi:hypothetical protein